MAKAVSPEQAVLTGLRKAVEALPDTKLLSGTGGVFPGGAKGKALAELAIGQGFVISKEEKAKKGKPKVYAIITEKGIRRVLDADSPKAALEALLPVVQAVGKQPTGPDPTALRHELARATETCVRTIQEGFAKLESTIMGALSPSSAPAISPGVILTALQHALERVETPVAPAAPSVPPPADSAQLLEQAIVAFVNSWVKEKTVGCPFDVLWGHLRERLPYLTIGAFQDSLRRLHDAGRVRLGGWARMLDDLPQPQLAFFVSSQVMYYAQPVHPHG